MDHFLETGFVDRHFTSLQRFDFPRVVINADNVVAHVGEASAGDKTDVTGTNDGKIHANEATQRVNRSRASSGTTPENAVFFAPCRSLALTCALTRACWIEIQIETKFRKCFEGDGKEHAIFFHTSVVAHHGAK
jgi:hypothetical protein